jgi:IPT/TIG domain
MKSFSAHFKINLALIIAAANLFSCSKPTDNPAPVPIVTSITPVGIGFSDSGDGIYDATVVVPYTGGNGLDYPAGQPIASTGITGFTMTLKAGKLNNVTGGNLLFNFKGTTTTTGVTFFDISFGGQSAKVNVSVSFLPQILDLATFSPESGVVGDTIVLTGTKFDADKTKNIVYFGNVPATVASATATQIKTIVPEGANTNKITVKVGLNTTTSDTDFSIFRIYIAGQEYNPAGNGQAYAKVWINSVGINLPLDGTKSTSGNAIAIGDGAIYVAGGSDVAKYWIDGVAVNIGNNTFKSSINGIAISGSNVYVAGYEYNASGTHIAKLWKDGNAVNLSDGTKSAHANAIVVVGGNVYVAGYDGKFAKVWKNGTVLSTLTDGVNNAEATAITVVGTEVFVAGRDGNVSKYWRNGNAVALTDGKVVSRTSAIAVSNGDVYVAGYEDNYLAYGVAKYWKNGVAVDLGQRDTGSGTSSIAVLGSDVYVTGHEYLFSGSKTLVAKYWKNGKAKNLSTTQSLANAILIAP